jgi:hypothetical protein
VLFWGNANFSHPKWIDQTNMYNKNTDKDLIGAAITAALGAGIVTSFAVAQGQNPLIGLGITAIAALFGVICHYLDLI